MFLSKLDTVIGDGDHGISIAKGFTSAVDRIEKTSPKNISDLLKITGTTITSTIGGVAGPVFGVLFSEMGKIIEPQKESVDIKDLYQMFSAALEKIMKLGGARPGDKTMVDALNPAVETLKKYSLNSNNIKEALKEMADAAKKGAESTKNMVATKGRARYSGERSLGYEDAGANTIFFILKSFYDSV